MWVKVTGDLCILQAGDVCQFEGCEETATAVACGRELPRDMVGHPTPQVYCQKHSELVSDEHSPEYTEHCPNCGCHFGVN